MQNVGSYIVKKKKKKNPIKAKGKAKNIFCEDKGLSQQTDLLALSNSPFINHLTGCLLLSGLNL